MLFTVSAPALARADVLRPTGLCAEQEGREVRGARKRVGHAAKHLAAAFADDAGGVSLHGMAVGVVGCDEEPSVIRPVRQGAAHDVGQHTRVISPVDRIRRALRPGQIRRGRRGVDEYPVAFSRQRGNGQCHRAVGNVHDHVHAIVVPTPGDVRSDLGLVLVVARQHVDAKSLAPRAEVLDCLGHARHRHGAADVLVWAGLVAQHADGDRALFLRPGAHQRHRRTRRDHGPPRHRHRRSPSHQVVRRPFSLTARDQVASRRPCQHATRLTFPVLGQLFGHATRATYASGS